MSKKTVVIEVDFTYRPNEEDVYVYLKELIKDRSLSWEFKIDYEIEQLRELADAGKEDRTAIDELVDENLRLREENECFEAMKAGVETRIADLNAEIERLRELLRKCQPYIAGTHSCGRTEARELFREIEKEVGDE